MRARGVDLKYPRFAETEADDFVVGDLRFGADHRRPGFVIGGAVQPYAYRYLVGPLGQFIARIVRRRLCPGRAWCGSC